MNMEDIAKQIAIGLINTGIEGGYDCVTCSTAGDYPSIGCSQWEGGRGDNLLSYIDGGFRFIGRSYSDIVDSGELEDLSNLLDSESGRTAQIEMLANDCIEYVETLMNIPIDDPRCLIYAGMWCPTSHYMVKLFIDNRVSRIDINNLMELFNIFRDEYADAVECSEYFEGYMNRAIITYEYVMNLDLSEYGIPQFVEM